VTRATVDTVVIGAGHAGLAVSRLLTEAGRDHVVLDRGGIAERWRSERWDSLHLLTPSWMTRLPGWSSGTTDPDGYLSAAEFRQSLQRYAQSFGAPFVGDTAVRSVTAYRGCYAVRTDDDTWRARQVVIATGPHGAARVPRAVTATGLELVTSNRYRRPELLPDGGVLVVGASASGVQIADELARAGRQVLLAVGRHQRLPRRYRGRDIYWWLQRTGRLARTIDEVPDPVQARHEPSLQLVGRAGVTGADAEVDLAGLQRRGVRLAGRLLALRGHRAQFADDLAESVGAADAAMRRFLDAVDCHVTTTGLESVVLPPVRPARTVVAASPTEIDLRAVGIGSVVVAAGYRADHSWLHLPITDGAGTIRQRRGVTAAPGVYVVGQRFQHRRDSALIDGARHDAHDVVTHLTTGRLPAAGSALLQESAA
jgi:putative flavoprotein involved in K+ transport